METRETEHRPAPARTLTRFIVYLSRGVDPLSQYGAFLAGFMLFSMMALTFIDIVGAQIGKLTHIGFFRPIIGGYEISELMMCILISFGLAYTARYKGHIRVDLILQYTSRKVACWFDILAYGLAFIFYAVIAWQGWLNGWNSLESQAASTVLLIPLYPFNFALVLGAAITALVFFRDFLKAIEGVSA